jgi:hypothetical protein
LKDKLGVSAANISKAQTLLGYHPTHKIEEGLDAALEWYRQNVVINKLGKIGTDSCFLAFPKQVSVTFFPKT